MSVAGLVHVTGNEEAVWRLFHPRQVAVIGASSRPGALSWWPAHLLRTYGFAGEILPVNPNRAEIEGLPCRRSIDELPEGLDLAVVALNAEGTDAAVRALADRCARAVVLPTQGLGEQGPEGKAIERAMIDYANARGTRVVGPNTDGVGNLGRGMIASIQPLFGEGLPAGSIGVVTQSGATAGSLLGRLKHEGLGAALYASTGNESDLGWADYVSVVVQDPQVRMVLSFVESIRKTDDFVHVAELAAELGKPIALIKVGRSDQAARRAAAHTGALAGSDRIYDAIFRRLGIIRVDELSELVAIAKTYLSVGAPVSRGVGILSVSGGQAGAVADRAVRAGLEVPPVGADVERRLNELLTFGSAFNPCDLTGEVAKDPDLAASVYAAFADEPTIGAIVYARKELTGTIGPVAAQNLAKIAHDRGTPLAIYAMDGIVGAAERAVYDDHGVPLFHSLSEMFTALGRLAEHHAHLARRGELGPLHLGPAVPGGRDAAVALAGYGLPFPEEELVGSEDAAVAAAERIGFPVVLKVADERILHKTEAGGVVLDVTDADATRAAYRSIVASCTLHLGGDAPAAVAVVEQITGGVELIVGATVDAAFGPFLLLGSGGVLAELLADVVLLPLPVTRASIAAAIDSLKVAKLLAGFRGSPPADVEALLDAVEAFARFVADRRDELDEVDLNPVVVLPVGQGVRVLDQLIEWR